MSDQQDDKEKLDRLMKKLKAHFEHNDATIQEFRKLLFGNNNRR
jgi:hypothetical protein